jgi:hypothetical protein
MDMQYANPHCMFSLQQRAMQQQLLLLCYGCQANACACADISNVLMWHNVAYSLVSHMHDVHQHAAGAATAAAGFMHVLTDTMH